MRSALASASQRKDYYSAYIKRAYDTRRQVTEQRAREQVRTVIMNHIKDLEEQE